MDEILRRVVDDTGVPNIVELLGDDLAGADFTSLMMHVMRQRARRVSPADVMRQYARDRFVAPGSVPVAHVRAAEDVLFGTLPARFEAVSLAPVLPLGTCSAVAPISQHQVVSTVRRSEVAADPTNALALEASLRRSVDSQSDAVVALAASQRVVRAQQFEGPVSFAHFQLFGLVTAGRDRGDRAFEREHVAEHLAFHVDALLAAGADAVRVECTDFTGEWREVWDAVRPAVADRAELVDAPDRPGGRAYYLGLCFKTHATFGATTLEIGDGGLVDWTRQLVGSRKERCVISGLGVERLALGLPAS